MTINQRTKVPMQVAPPPIRPGSDSEVVPRARRRTFTNADKRRILQAADLCTKPGEVGALMRREGVYSSSLSTWRRQREAADMAPWHLKSEAPRLTPRASMHSTSHSSPASGTTCVSSWTRRSS